MAGNSNTVSRKKCCKWPLNLLFFPILGSDDANGFSDKIQKPIQVKPEGFPVEKVSSEFLCRQSDENSTTVDLGQIELPDSYNLVEGSARSFITVSGDIPIQYTVYSVGKRILQVACHDLSSSHMKLSPNFFVPKFFLWIFCLGQYPILHSNTTAMARNSLQSEVVRKC